jgi:hypothetical protein
MSATFVMLIVLFYPYVKKWVYPYINNKNSKVIDNKNKYIKDKTYLVKNKVKYVKDKVDPLKNGFINKNRSELVNKSKFKNLDLINRSTEKVNDFSTVPDHQNKKLNKDLSRDLIDSEYNQDLNNKQDNKEENQNVTLNEWGSEDIDLNNDMNGNLNKLDIDNEEDHDFVAKSWNEPMMENQKELIDNFKDSDEHSKDYKNSSSNKSESKISFLTNDESILNNELSYDGDDNLKNKSLRNKDLKAIDNGDNNLKTKSTPNLNEQEKSSVGSNDLSLAYDNNLGKLSVGRHIIFNYNDESYLSEILEIKHNNIKVLYRGNHRWIQISDVKKIL